MNQLSLSWQYLFCSASSSKIDIIGRIIKTVSTTFQHPQESWCGLFLSRHLALLKAWLWSDDRNHFLNFKIHSQKGYYDAKLHLLVLPLTLPKLPTKSKSDLILQKSNFLGIISFLIQTTKIFTSFLDEISMQIALRDSAMQRHGIWFSGVVLDSMMLEIFINLKDSVISWLLGKGTVT